MTTKTTEYTTLTDGQLDSLRAAYVRMQAARAKEERKREKRRAALEKKGLYQPPVAWRGPGSGHGLIVEQHGVKLSTRQQGVLADMEEAIASSDEGLPIVPVKSARYEDVKADVKADLGAGKVEKTTDSEELKAALSPRALMTRGRKMPEVIPGTEHLDAKQRAALANLRRRVRESEVALAAYLRDDAKATTIARAEEWVKSRKANLESKMRQFGVPTTTTE